METTITGLCTRYTGIMENQNGNYYNGFIL